jgi:predicted DNA-binding protein (UPF0251 family)
MAAKPLLNLTTLVERRTIAIDGAEYELLAPGQVSLLMFHRIGLRVKQAEEMRAIKPEDVSKDQLEELSTSLDEITSLILKAPAKVRARLSDVQKLAIMQCFTQTPPPAVAAAEAEGSEAPSTGARKSRD